MDWWDAQVRDTMLDNAPYWVRFDLDTVLLDTLRSSPRIQSVSHRASISLEQIIQQDAAFDPNVLFESRIGRKNDPVGNELITGGPPRLIEESASARGGIQRTNRRGTQVDLSQELSLLNSNSEFFSPVDQGNSRLSLSLTQPLMQRGGQVYNERLLTQARIDSRVSWQEMRGEVEQRLADVINAYWRLYELRCHLLQQRELLRRGQQIESLLVARQAFDASRIELAKAKQRVARRTDRLLRVTGEIQIQQARFIGLVGSNQLSSAGEKLELVPLEIPTFPSIGLDLRDAFVRGLENRPEVRAVTADLETAALAIKVTRTELEPQLTAVFEAYSAGLNGNFQALQSFTDQFSTGGPGLAGGLKYDMPFGRRAARARHREAHHRYRQRAEELRETMQVTRQEISTAIINAQTAIAQRETKHRLLVTALDEEAILTRRWEMMAGDGANVGTVLETLLDAQQRRTDAEREWTSAVTRYVSSLADLQRAMGTLLINHEITPLREACGNQIHFLRTDPTPQVPMLLNATLPEDTQTTDQPAARRDQPAMIELSSPEFSPDLSGLDRIPADLPRTNAPNAFQHSAVLAGITPTVPNPNRPPEIAFGQPTAVGLPNTAGETVASPLLMPMVMAAGNPAATLRPQRLPIPRPAQTGKLNSFRQRKKE
ncbi:MAG: TolC family protein [Rubripirellula sp.]|nr:TolC family protein [Rubripirellula sp.]